MILETRSEAGKIISVLAIAGMIVLSFAYSVSPAQALTQSEANVICSLFNCSATQKAALQVLVTGSQPSFIFTRDLTIGSTGEDVRQLQIFLNKQGFTVAAFGAGSAGQETSYFGPLTQSAVARYQAANGIVPVAGYFGPITRASVNAKLAAQPPVPPPIDDDELQGGAGSISEYTLISSLSNEEVGEGEDDVQVAGVTVEAGSGSDIELTAVKLVFGNDDLTGSSATADDDFDEYVSEVSVWFNGEEVARIDGDEFTDDNLWSQTLTLDSGAVIDAGDTADLVVAVSGVSNLDSTFVAESWDVDFRAVRFVDAQGASTSEDPSTGVRLFSFESFATSVGAELKIASDDDAINDAHILDVHATDETESEDVSLLSFTLEAEGSSDLEIQKFGFDVDVTGASHVDDIIAGGATPSIKLVIEGEEYGTATYGGNGGAAYAEDTNGDVGQSETVLFDDVDYTIPAGETVNVVVKADLLAVDTDLDEGDTIAVAIGETESDQVTFVKVKDSTNENLVDADITGTASAGAHGIFDTYIDLDFVSVTEAVLADDDADDNDIITFTMVFDITARGGSVYVGDTSAGTTVADASMGTGAVTDAIVYRVYDDGAATTDDLADLVSFTTPNGVTDSTNNILITDGHTSRVTMTVTQTNGTIEDNGIYYLDLAGVAWGLADDAQYEFMYKYNLDEFESGTETIN